MPPAPRSLAIVAPTAALVLLGCLVGLGLSEGGYRAYLFVKHPKRFTSPERDSYFAAYNVSHWEFDQEFGYIYPPGRIIDYTGVHNGYVKDCSRLDIINRHGNIGPIVGNYDDADLKVLVFGDSWSAFHKGGWTWPHFLQRILEERLRRNVHVVNFGRDGYSMLQIFDLAAAKIPEWRPDLAIFAFISDDLARARFWRTVVGEGDAVRVLTTPDPLRTPPPHRSADTYLLLPSASYEWCSSMAGSQRVDRVLKALIEKHRNLVHRNTAGVQRWADPYTLRHSYLASRLLHRDPFASLVRQMPVSVNPRVAFSSYASDARFVDDLERIKRSAVPWVLFHLATYPEIRANQEYILSKHETALLESLRAVTGKAVLGTTDYVEMPVPAPERMNVSEEDYHPSLWGMEFYAKAVAEALIRNRLVR